MDYPANGQGPSHPRSKKASLWQRFSGVAWLCALWGLLGLTLVAEFESIEQRLEAGMVSPLDIRAPERITYQSEVRTQRERDRAGNSVEAIYSPPDRSQAVKQTSTVEAVARFLEAVRADPYASEESKDRYVAALQPVQFEAEISRALLTMPEEEWRAVVAETQRVVDLQMRGEIRESRLPTILRTLPNQLSISLSDEQARVVTAWAGALITPNTFLDTDRTEQARQAARDAVAPVEWTYEADQIVVRSGEVLSQEQLEALQQLGLSRPAGAVGGKVATLLFLVLLVFPLGLYLSRVHPEHFLNPRVMALLTLLLTTLTLGLRLSLSSYPLLAYLLPSATAAMLLGVLLGVDLALIITLIFSLIIGFVTRSMELLCYSFVGGLMASLLLWRVERLASFVWTGALVGGTNLAIVAIFALQEGTSLTSDIWARLLMALLNGVASASLALAGFYVLSSLLNITTFLQLMELARPTHPLFRELLLKAPGTYHHSIVVSNLAEAAAEAVGADMLLVRVAAYYHDVGKLVNPQYFVENQADGINPHDALNDPYKSAQIILAHVSDGVKLAQRHNLPRRLIDFILQHHGTTAVAWFYNKACERDGAPFVDVARFRYPGPKPLTREAAILMLADTVEATARAIKPGGVTEIDELIRKINDTKLREGQFDECELTLRDLDTIRSAFIKVLQGIYHPRISYPDAKPALPRYEDPYERHPTPAPAERPPVGSPPR